MCSCLGFEGIFAAGRVLNNIMAIRPFLFKTKITVGFTDVYSVFFTHKIMV